MAAPLKAVLYAAKSTEDVRGSIPTQFEDGRAMAEREGWEIDAEFQDEGFSAYSGNRGPGLEEARRRAAELAEQDGSAVIVAQHSDRIARGSGDSPQAAEHLVEVLTWANRHNVKLRTVQDDLFENERFGLVMAAMMGQRNTEDSARKSAAVQAGKRRAFERGDFPGGPIPDGFERIDGEIRLDPERIEVIRLIGRLSDEGWGDPSVARELNRRGYRTKGGAAWTRRRIQDLLTNVLYYGGVAWRRRTKDEEVNWTGHVAPWTREDYGQRAKARAGRDLATGSKRSVPGRPHTNHALAGLAVCGRCLWTRGAIEVMRPLTSGYRRKDGSRRRTYVCRHVHGATGLCDMPPVDAEMIDTGVINQLDSYLGDFESWRDELLSGYANERQRLAREVEKAQKHLEEQERVCAKRDRLTDLASDDNEMREALRLVSEANEELERRKRRLSASEGALADVPTEAPADAMLDFYNELGSAVRGRLEGASTLARVNDALRDVFAYFLIDDSTKKPGIPAFEGVLVTPMLPDKDGAHGTPGFLGDPDEQLAPPLRTLSVPSPELANTWESANYAQALPSIAIVTEVAV